GETQTCLVDADSPEEALQKAKKEEFFREEIRLDWNNASIKVSSQKKKNENNNMIKKWAEDHHGCMFSILISVLPSAIILGLLWVLHG
ncbi:MAG: hypothetical protein ACLR2P_11395, partial [Bilophila wadsworthia]